jgi:hypothetical protein
VIEYIGGHTVDTEERIPKSLGIDDSRLQTLVDWGNVNRRDERMRDRKSRTLNDVTATWVA